MAHFSLPNITPSDPSYGVQLGVIPFDRSYCVLPGLLLAGAYPASAEPADATVRLQRLLEVGVRNVVNLTEPGEANWEGQRLVDYVPELTRLAAAQKQTVFCERLSIRDMDIPTKAGMQAILNAMDEAIAQKQMVYVHCWGGRGRTGTVIGCYLARHGLATGEQALNIVKYLRRTDAKAHTESPETPQQKDFVRRWSRGE